MEITYNRLPPYSAATFNLNHSDDDNTNNNKITSTTTTTATPVIQHMFEKPLTPSDVGKLNRLVIPKQHAENYFPLGQQKLGSVLSFEDIESRKLWHFRYSYWNSSQSYVLTKGWSQYVKVKRLHAGDVVLFQRRLSDSDRMFIGWRRRATAAVAAAVFVQDRMVAQPLPLPYQLPYCLHDAGEMYENVDTNYQRGVVATRRLRLFGVNLECQDDSEPSTPYGSSQGGRSDHQYNFSCFNNLHHEMKH